jgi:hypothetical protein
MPGKWAALDTLIRDLGAVRSAAFAARADAGAYHAIEQAIAEATDAIVAVIDTPTDGSAIARAREAIEVVADVITLIDAEIARSLRLRGDAAELRGRARELVHLAAQPPRIR